jgi:hypothetical protein
VLAWHATWHARGARDLGLGPLAVQMLAVAYCASPEDGFIQAELSKAGLPPPSLCRPRTAEVSAASTRSPPAPWRSLVLLLGLVAWFLPQLTPGHIGAGRWLGLAITLAGLGLAACALILS